MSSSYNALTAAIALEENSSYPNNPGAIMDASSGRPLQFPNPQAGLDALQLQLEYDVSGQSAIYNPNESISAFESSYTGGDPNAGKNVASMLGVSPSTPISQLNDASVSPSNTFWQRVKNFMSNAMQLGGMDLQNATGSSLGTPTANGSIPAPETASGNVKSTGQLSSIAVDAVAILLGLILVAISVFGLSQVREAVSTATKIGVKATV